MEAYFSLEDYVKNMLFNSKTEEDIEKWQHILDLNKINSKSLFIN